MKSPTTEEAGSIIAPTIMDQGTFEFWTVSEHGIEFKRETPQDEWLKVVEKLTGMFEGTHRLHIRTMFMLGDALRFGEAAYGEDYAQAIDMTCKVMQLSEKTIKNAAWICASVDASRRRETLTLAHHEAVAALDNEEQNELLGKAESENLTVSGLKKEVKARHPKTSRGKTRKAIIDLESEEGLHHAQEKVSEWLAAQAEGKVVLSKKWKDALLAPYKTYRRCFMGSGHAKAIIFLCLLAWATTAQAVTVDLQGVSSEPGYVVIPTGVLGTYPPTNPHDHPRVYYTLRPKSNLRIERRWRR